MSGFSTQHQWTAWKEMKETIPLIISKKLKYLETNLTEEMKDMYWKLQNIAERNFKRPN